MTGGRSAAGTSCWVFVSYLLFVSYGSLVPLDYHPMPWDEALRRFANIPFLQLGADSRADWIANGVLYLPLGLLLARLLRGPLGASAIMAFIGSVGICGAIAVAVEFAQLSFPPRTVSQNDLIAEVIGSALGAWLAFVVQPWAQRLRHALNEGGQRVTTHALEAYALLYLALSFFPYDFALSSDELLARMRGANWAWLLTSGEHGRLTSLLQLAVELLLCAPLGWLWQRVRGGANASGWKAARVGLGLGLFIEIGQFFVLSGYSQGASVLTRSAAFTLGATALPWLMHSGAAAARERLRGLVLPLLVLWLPMLLWVNGWVRNPWHGAAGAAATWRELHLLPFYYHYYTTEAVALFSLGTVSLMYLPLSLAGWARGWGRGRSLGLVALTVLAVEASKLFLVGMHPDPTNLIIALGANVVFWRLLVAWERPAPAASVVAAAPQASPKLAAPWPWLMVTAAVVGALLYPVHTLPLLVLLATAGWAVWRRPPLTLFIVPAAMPALDLVPWSGRLYLDEFDFVLATCLGIGWARTLPAPRQPVDRCAVIGGALVALLTISLAIGSLRGLLPWPGLDTNALATLGGPLAPLRIVKGAAWAGLFLLLWRRLASAGTPCARWFGAGAALGLLLTVACIVWERLAFGVLWDFTADLRVTGLFSAMSKGGAYVECFIAVVSAFVVAELLRPSARAVHKVALLTLLAAAVFALMVTYSRNGYAAFAAMLVVSLLGLAHRKPGTASRWPWALVATAVAAAVAIPIALSPFASTRLATSMQDLQVREKHWRDALALRAPGWDSLLFGEGIGRFPERHYWGSQEPVRAASYRVVSEGKERFLRLGPGAPLYIEQVVARPAAVATLNVEARLRSVKAQPRLSLSLCEKWTLSSLHCESLVLTAPAVAEPGKWVSVRGQVKLPAAADERPWPRLPLKLSLITPVGDATLDVADLALRTAGGQNLLANASFADGMDRWFFATDTDPPWHIHSLPVALLFDQGWFGLTAWTALLLWGFACAARRWHRGDDAALAPAAALAAFLVSGALNTLIDEPRFLWLVLVLAGMCMVRGSALQRRP